MTLETLLTPFSELLVHFTFGNAIMIAVGLVLLYLAIAKEYEPVLLLPIGFGCILANLGMAATDTGTGFLSVLIGLE